jgi:cytochrome c peroxidase
MKKGAMKKGAMFIFSLFKTLRFSVAGLALVFFLDGTLQQASAQTAKSDDPAQTRAWAPAAIEHAQKMRVFKDPDRGSQPTPPVIPRFEADDDPSGQIASFQPGGPTFTALNPFFQNLGTNGRTCFTCHQPQAGWTVGAAGVQARFKASGGTDPIFRLVDGATCPSDDVSTLKAKREAYKLLTEKGLIRVGIPLPAPEILQFEVVLKKVVDPYNCTTNPKTGLTNPTTGIMSMYRRPLPSTNLGFLSTIMADGREPTLENQAIDATLTHAQGNPNTPLTVEQQRQIVDFETGIFTAQNFDKEAHDLNALHATGGPKALSQQLAKFFIGVNDPFGMNPTGAPFDKNIFDFYKYWQGLQGNDAETVARKSIARGEEVFNTTPIKITGVAGINDVLKVTTFNGFCGTCHDTPNAGDHSIKAPLNIGIADAGAKSPPALDISGLPVFTLKCTKGPLAGQTFVVTDPGRALISGNCADIGKIKGPILRGLAARAPYFHNGSAATLLDAVNFYDRRFSIGFTAQQKEDLVNFLKTL